MADDSEMFAMMGMPMAFGKQAKKRTVDVAARYETTKRTEPEPVNVSDSVCNARGGEPLVHFGIFGLILLANLGTDRSKTEYGPPC